MIHQIKNILFYWFPPIIWMSIIFFLSSRPTAPVSEDYSLNFMFYKTIHLIVYAFLYFLLFRLFYFLENKKKPSTRTFIIPMIIAIAYGASDEYHQTLVPTREGRLRDVFIDTLGIVLMFKYTKYNLGRLKLFL